MATESTEPLLLMRGLLIALCAVVAALAAADYYRWHSNRKAIAELIDREGLAERHPRLLEEVGRHYDPVGARLRVARTLLYDELDRSWLADVPEPGRQRELQRGVERLRRAKEIATDGWPRRPASWQAALVLGGAAHLELIRTGDPALIAHSDLWEGPLKAAHELGPGQTGPIRFMGAAYLGNWASLTPEQRHLTVELLRDGFRDRETFRLLIGEWLRVAPSLGEGLELVPSKAWAWRILEGLFSSRGDWQRYLLARRRWYSGLLVDLQESLATAEDQIRGGDRRRARALLLALLHDLPQTNGFVPAMERILELLPAGPVGRPHAEALERWLDWAFERCFVHECPFSPTAMARLTLLSGTVEPYRSALAALMSDDLAQAELWERRAVLRGEEDWAPYFLLKAEALAERGHEKEAAEALERLSRGWLITPRYWLARRRLADLARAHAASLQAESELDRLRRTLWEAGSWKWRDGQAHLALLPIVSATGLVIEIVEAPEEGSIVEVLCDGDLIELFTAGSGESLRLDLPLSRELHELTLRFPRGRLARPGRVELL